MTKQISAFVFGALLLGATISQAAVWQDTETWSPEWEQKFAVWVQNEFNEDIYMSGDFKGIPTDCADAVYLSRVIFSYKSKLPFVIKDSTGGTNKITNQMSRFDNIKDPLERVRKFMLYVADATSTKTLPNDTFPIAINRTNLRPGTVWSRPRITKDNIWRRIIGANVKEDPGHAEVVKDVSDTGVVSLIGSTVPKDLRNLNTTSSMVFMPIESSTGFRNWMQPAFYAQTVESLPGYSLEQFTDLGKGANGSRSLSDWTKQVQDRLALREESKEEEIDRQVGNVCSLVNARIDIIQKSEARRLALGGQCMNAGDYDSYSTPSRDKRIKTTLKQINEIAGGFGITAAQRAKALKPHLDKCPDIQIAPGKSISLYDFSILMLKGDVSSDPNDSFGARWGLESSTAKCPKYE